MTADLARSLIDAAGKAVYDEIKKWPLPSEPWLRAGQVGALGATQEDVGRVAVVAVLETLAALLEEHESHDVRMIGEEWRLELAVEVKEDTR